MNNVVMIVIDALSNWYIKEYIKCYPDSFFSEIERQAYTAENMFSEGPFTEAGIQGMLASQKALDNSGYFLWLNKSNKPLYQVFAEAGYETYFGGHTTMCCDFKTGTRGADLYDSYSFAAAVEYNLWKGRIQGLLDYFESGHIYEEEIKLMEEVLEYLFQCFANKDDEEYGKFRRDRKEYVKGLFREKEKHSFYTEFIDDSLLRKNTRKAWVETKNISKHPLSVEEAVFCEKLAWLNRARLYEINEPFGQADERLQKKLDDAVLGNNNRCVQSNNQIITHIRDGYEDIPTIGEEVNNFFDWYEKRQIKNKPFISYIHVFDFHYPENIMERNMKEQYINELNELQKRMDKMPSSKMSVSKMLSLYHIEKELKVFIQKMKKHELMENTFVAITADHGISNFMYPINQTSDERWSYNRTNFNIPFYLFGPEINKKKDFHLLENVDIPVTICNLCGVNYPAEYIGKDVLANTDFSRDYVTGEWINGIPNLMRRPIRFGIRNYAYSLTYEVGLNEFFESGSIVFIADLKNDEDEVFNKREGLKNNAEIINLLQVLKKRWYQLLKHYILEEDGHMFFKNTRLTSYMKKEEQVLLHMIEEQQNVSYQKYINAIEGKQIILFGASELAKKLLETGVLEGPILEVWDNSSSKENTWFYGHKVTLPYHIGETSRVVVVIANRYEIEVALQLKELGIDNFYIGKRLLKLSR